MIWNSQQDHFTYITSNIVVSLNELILSEIVRIFCLLELLGPVVLMAKFFMQECWKLKIEWDKPVTLALGNKLRIFVKQLSLFNHITIP